MMNYGDVATGVTVRFTFTTQAATGASVAPSSAFEAADLKLYKNDTATPRSSANGITMTSPFNSITGLHHVAIDLSDNTDAGFYAAGSDYTAVLSPDETVDGLTVVAVVGMFSIENRPVALTSAERNSVADALLNRNLATGTDSGSATVRTVRQALRFLRNKWSITGGTMTVTTENDATASWTAAVTTTSGDPVTAIDPAGP